MTPSRYPRAFRSSPDGRARICGKERDYLFGIAVYAPGGRCGPRWQGFYQLVVLTQGGLRVTVDGVSHDLVPGEAILQKPGTREFCRFSSGSESTHTWCQIWPGLLSATDCRRLAKVRGVHQVPPAVQLLIKEGLAVQNHNSAALHGAMAALARACLLRFAAHAHGPSTAAPIHPALQRALDITENRFKELHSAADLARRVGISASRLRALYREARGESPSATIRRLKVEYAIQLIRSTGLTLGEIAEDCGYANPFHLSRCVRRHTGCSPRRLRQGEWK